MSSQSRNSQSNGNLPKQAPGIRVAVTDPKAAVGTTPSARVGQQIVQGTNSTINNNINKRNADIKPKSTQTLERSDVSCKHPLHGTLSSGTLYDAQTIRENMKKAFLANPHVNMDDEAEYYETVRRLDVCGHCWAAQQKYAVAPFKLKEKSPGLTLYQKDYVKHPLEKGPAIKNDFYNTFNIEEPMDFGTTMRNDYKPWKVGPVDRPTMNGKSGASGIPFAGRSGYKAEYIDWGNIPVNLEKAANNVTVIPELPFVGKSAYQENFAYQPGEQARPVDRDLWKHKAKSPLSPGIPFLGDTTHNKTFKPFKVGGNPLFVEEQEYEPTEAYPDQFKSTYKQDYTGTENWRCPAKIFMENHPHPKMNTLKP